MASAAPAASSDGFFSNFARKIGLSGAVAGDTTASAPPPPPAPAKPKTAEAKPRPEAPKAAKPAETKQAASRPPLKPSVSDTPVDQAAQSAAPANAVVAGSAPIMQANSFENRFSAVK
jgi:hypothetical protein